MVEPPPGPYDVMPSRHGRVAAVLPDHTGGDPVLTRATAALLAASWELRAALEARTRLATVVGQLRMRRAFLEGQLAQFEAEQDRERRAAPAPRRDLLAGIRNRLFGADGPEAA